MAVLKYKRVVVFVGITFALTLLFHFVIRLVGQPQGYLGIAMGIPLVALLMVRLLYPFSLWEYMGITRTVNPWLLMSIIIPVGILGITYGLIVIVSGNLIPEIGSVLALLFRYTLVGISIAAISALFEEVAWRGYLQKELAPLGELRASVIIGVVWAVWHMPIAVFYLQFASPFIGTIIYVAQLFLLSLHISYVRLKAKNVLAAALMHGMINAIFFNPQFFPAQFVGTNVEALKLVALVVALTGVVVYERVLSPS